MTALWPDGPFYMCTYTQTYPHMYTYTQTHTVHIFTITATLPPHAVFYITFRLQHMHKQVQRGCIYDQTENAPLKGIRCVAQWGKNINNLVF